MTNINSDISNGVAPDGLPYDIINPGILNLKVFNEPVEDDLPSEARARASLKKKEELMGFPLTADGNREIYNLITQQGSNMDLGLQDGLDLVLERGMYAPRENGYAINPGWLRHRGSNQEKYVLSAVLTGGDVKKMIDTIDYTINNPYQPEGNDSYILDPTRIAKLNSCRLTLIEFSQKELGRRVEALSKKIDSDSRLSTVELGRFLILKTRLESGTVEDFDGDVSDYSTDFAALHNRLDKYANLDPVIGSLTQITYYMERPATEIDESEELSEELVS